ncbi:MAG: hypothetical protein WA003_15805 [Desulfuromonadaceae bacterium]
MIIKPEGAGIITVDWLNGLEIMVIKTRKQFISFIEAAGKDVAELCSDWDECNGSVSRIMLDGSAYFVMIFPKPSRRVLVHEAVHVVHCIMENKGMQTGHENTEVVAYMVDFVSSRLFEMFPRISNK